MRKSLLASLFATGSVFVIAMAAPATAQTYDTQDPFGPLGAIVTAPVTAAGDIATAPIAAATGVVAPGMPIYASNRTAAFVANIVPNINFLDDSSRLALERSANPALRRFAHREAVEQTIAGNSMTAWAQTNPPVLTGRSAYAGDPLVGLASLPINIVVGAGDIFTGGAIVPASDGRALLRAQADDLTRLSGLTGPAFDSLYRESQLDSLRQLATLYTDYAANGSDPALRRLAQAELPKINRRIYELNRI